MPVTGRDVGPLRNVRIGGRLTIGGEGELDINAGGKLVVAGTRVTTTGEEINALAHFPGLKASAILRVAANVADEETVTIGNDVYEFDRAENGVAKAGAIPVTGHADDTPANATDALILAINASGTEPVTAVDISDNQILIVANDVGVNTTAVAEDMAGANNAWDTAALRGGADPGVKRIVRVERVPNAAEVALGRVLIPLSFAPTAAIVQVRVTATGAEKTLTGFVLLKTAEQRIDIINDGATAFAATDTITVLAME